MGFTDRDTRSERNVDQDLQHEQEGWQCQAGKQVQRPWGRGSSLDSACPAGRGMSLGALVASGLASSQCGRPLGNTGFGDLL